VKNPWKQYSKLSPQREDGNRQIASDVFRALMSAELSGSEFRIVMAIIDKTWGFNKESDAISISQLMGMTNLAERTVKESIKILKEKRVLFYAPSNIRVRVGSPINEYIFNKHYDTWKTQGCRKVHACTITSIKGAEKCKKGCTSVHTQKKTTKETITKEITPPTPHIVLPDWLKPELWEQFKEHRNSLKLKLSANAENLNLKKLISLKEKGYNPQEIIEATIANGWKVFYEPKQTIKLYPPTTQTGGRAIKTSYDCHNCHQTFSDYNLYLTHECKEELMMAKGGQ